MATQILTPTPFVTDGAGLNITPLLATPTGTTLQFSNTGREMLFVVPSASAETVTVDVGALVDGQAVTNFTAVTLTSTDIYCFGPYHSVLDLSGTNTIQVVLSTITAITVALLQTVGVY
jgi:hypothetical protein